MDPKDSVIQGLNCTIFYMLHQAAKWTHSALSHISEIFRRIFFLSFSFCLWFYISVNCNGHVEMVSSPKRTFSLATLMLLDLGPAALEFGENSIPISKIGNEMTFAKVTN